MLELLRQAVATLEPGHGISVPTSATTQANGFDRRQAVTARLLRIYHLAATTGRPDRVIIFGSYITTKPDSYRDYHIGPQTQLEWVDDGEATGR